MVHHPVVHSRVCLKEVYGSAQALLSQKDIRSQRVCARLLVSLLESFASAGSVVPDEQSLKNFAVVHCKGGGTGHTSRLPVGIRGSDHDSYSCDGCQQIRASFLDGCERTPALLNPCLSV